MWSMKNLSLIAEEDAYMGRGTGFTLEKIDGIILTIYSYTPLGGSSYIELPADIQRKRSVINPQNSDNFCLKWAILAKHEAGVNKERVGEKYIAQENKYNFTGLSFPTPLHDIAIFEKKNHNVSINVYGLKKKFQVPRKLPTHKVYPLKVVNLEKPGPLRSSNCNK